MSSIAIRLRSNRYEFLGLRDGRRTRLGVLRGDDLTLSIQAADLTDEESSEIREKADRLEELLRNQAGQLAIDLTRRLAEFETTLGINGPQGADILFEALETALSSTLRKVRRMNELIVRRSAV